MAKSKIYEILKITIIPVIFWNFYSYVGFNQMITKMISFIFVLLFIIYNFRSWFFDIRIPFNNNSIRKELSCVIAIIFISVLNALLYWNQSPILTYRSGIIMYMLFLFYYYDKNDVKIEIVESSVLLLGLIYALLWLYALSQAPNVVFGNLETVDDNRGFYRILQLSGFETLVFAYFYILTRIELLAGLKKYLHVVLLVACGLIIFFSLARIVIGATIVLSAIYILRKRALFLIVLITIALLFGSDAILNNNSVISLLDLTESRGGISEERMPEYTNAFKLFPFHISTFLFGNGAAHIESSYGIRESMLALNYCFNRSDTSFVGIYVTYGITCLLFYLKILFKVLFNKIPEDKEYLKYFIAFIFITALTQNSLISYSFGFIAAIYILEKTYCGKNDDISNVA